MLARWTTLVVWALVAAGALFWGLRLFVVAPSVPAGTPVAANGLAVRGDLTRLLGSDPPPSVVAAAAEPPPDARFQLIGVVAPRATSASREGLALIAVDGKPARAFRVGAAIDGKTILKSVAARGAMLGPRDGAPQVTLNLLPPAAAATGALPSLGNQPTDGSFPNAGNPPAAALQPGRDRPSLRSPRGMAQQPGVPAETTGPVDALGRATQ